MIDKENQKYYMINKRGLSELKPLKINLQIQMYGETNRTWFIIKSLIAFNLAKLKKLIVKFRKFLNQLNLTMIYNTNNKQNNNYKNRKRRKKEMKLKEELLKNKFLYL